MRLQQLREVATNHRVLLCKIVNKFLREWHGKPSLLTWQQCKACTRRPGAVGPPRQSSHGKAVRDHFLGSSRRSFRTKSPTVYNPFDNLSRIKESCFITKTRKQLVEGDSVALIESKEWMGGRVGGLQCKPQRHSKPKTGFHTTSLPNHIQVCKNKQKQHPKQTTIQAIPFVFPLWYPTTLSNDVFCQPPQTSLFIM